MRDRPLGPESVDHACDLVRQILDLAGAEGLSLPGRKKAMAVISAVALGQLGVLERQLSARKGEEGGLEEKANERLGESESDVAGQVEGLPRISHQEGAPRQLRFETSTGTQGEQI